MNLSRLVTFPPDYHSSQVSNLKVVKQLLFVHFYVLQHENTCKHVNISKVQSIQCQCQFVVVVGGRRVVEWAGAGSGRYCIAASDHQNTNKIL